jgi:hypothetical protein
MFYTDLPSFRAANPGLAVEDFEEGNVGFGFDSPLNSTSSNDAFSPGDILPGVDFSNNPDNNLALVDSSHYPGLLSKTLIKGSEAPPGGSSSLDIVFSGDNIYAVGFHLYHTTGGSTGLIAADNDISIYGTMGLLGSQNVTTSDTGPVFFGVSSDSEVIKRINVDGIVPFFYSFEMIDNVEFNSIPIPGAIWLLGSGLVGLAGFRRRFKKK